VTDTSRNLQASRNRLVDAGFSSPADFVDRGCITRIVAEARKGLRDHGKKRGVWFVAEACKPPGLASRLRRLGVGALCALVWA
jgi:hypothetical protein